MLHTTLRTCSKTISPRLLRLNIGIMHRGVIKSSHCRIPWDWSAVCDKAVKTLTDCLTNTPGCMHVHTQAHATSCSWADVHAKSQWQTVSPTPCAWLTPILSWVSFKLTALRGKYNSLVTQARLCHCYPLKSYSLYFFFSPAAVNTFGCCFMVWQCPRSIVLFAV